MADPPSTDVLKRMDEVYSDLVRYEDDLKRKSAAMNQAQQLIGSALARVSDILVICDEDAVIRQVNAALLAMTGFAAEDLVGRPLSALLADEDAAVFRPDGEVVEYQTRFRGKDGDFTDLVLLSCPARFGAAGRLADMAIIGRPVGELRRAYKELNAAYIDLKRAEQTLTRIDKMASLGRLVAGVAHELNNPVSFIYGNVHSLSRYRQRLSRYLDAVHAGKSSDECEELRRSLKIDQLMADLGPLIDGTREGALRVSDIVKNLRRLSFVDLAAERQKVNIAFVARNAVHWIRQSAKRRVMLDDHLPEELLVEGTEGPLHQVFVNLIQNAVDAMESVAEPLISLSGRRVGLQVLLVVRDNGPGVPADHLSKIFDPFFTTKSVGKGTGLGLWVSWSIIRDHGGRIEVANSPDGGAAFTIILPAG